MIDERRNISSINDEHELNLMSYTTGRNEFTNSPVPIKNEAIPSVAAKFNDNNNIGERDRFV